MVNRRRCEKKIRARGERFGEQPESYRRKNSGDDLMVEVDT
jgi:hypothetical protein